MNLKDLPAEVTVEVQKPPLSLKDAVLEGCKHSLAARSYYMLYGKSCLLGAAMRGYGMTEEEVNSIRRDCTISPVRQLAERSGVPYDILKLHEERWMDQFNRYSVSREEYAERYL